MGNHTSRFEAENQDYASNNMNREEINEDLAGKVDNFLKKGGQVLKKIPGVQSALTPVGAGRKTPTATSGSYRPVTSTTNTEDFENWIHSLINEGYDLSDYTWEEMYESYIEEANNDPYGVSPGTRRVGGKGPNIGKFFGFGSPAKPGQGRTNTNPYGGSAPTTKPPTTKPPTTKPPTTKPPGGAPRPSAPVTSTGVGSAAKVAPSSLRGGAKQSSPANAPKDQKIKSGMDVWKSQMKSGDLKGATETGKNISALKYGANFAKPKTRNPLMDENSNWGSASRIVNDIANLYQSVYEAKKVDQDEDGDNDFADVRIARLIASGMSKEEAIRKVKNKTYNEQVTGNGMGKPMGGPYTDTATSSSKAKVKPSGITGTGMGKPMGGPYTDTPTSSSKAKVKPSGITGNGMGKPMGGPYTEGFENWIHSLINEGYDLSDYTWDEMYEIYEETQEEKEERLAKRRARVSELQSQGRVMTPARRTREKAAQKKQNERQKKLEKLGDNILSGIQGKSGVRSNKPMGSEPPEEKEAAPEATRKLQKGLKRDELASSADKILRKIKNENFQLWTNDLINEGYSIDKWSDEELVDLYEEIFKTEL